MNAIQKAQLHFEMYYNALVADNASDELLQQFSDRILQLQAYTKHTTITQEMLEFAEECSRTWLTSKYCPKTDANSKLDAAMAKPLTVIKERREDGKLVKMVYVPVEEIFKIYVGTRLEAIAGDQHKASTRFRIALNSYLPEKAKAAKKPAKKPAKKAAGVPLKPASMAAKPRRQVPFTKKALDRELREKFNEADLKLINAGWTLCCSLMTDCPENGRFGKQYTKDGEDFFLNVNTVDALPV